MTVVIVNWNGKPFLQTTVDAVRRFGPPTVRIFVLDNASRDDSVAWLRSRPDVMWRRLPINVGHDLALDIAFLGARTEFVVSLDVDAFPFRESWLDAVLDPLRAGAAIAGGEYRAYAHPSFCAMRLRTFVERGHSFLARYRGEAGSTGWDVGERISLIERSRGACHLIPVTSVRGPGPLGTIFGGVVYHNFYAVRHLREADPEAKLDDLVRRSDAIAAWTEATERLLG